MKEIKAYKVDIQVFGHTEVDEIVPLTGNTAIPINVSFISPRFSMQALYIEGNKFYRALGSGGRVLILSMDQK